MKATSKTTMLNLMILRAWRERWSDSQFSINIKKVLPRGVSGDVYNLADCILQQSLVGSTTNPLIMNYLKHSLCAHVVSHAAVLRRISKYTQFDRIHCIISLVEFLDSIIDGVTCRNKSEEQLLPSAIVSLVYWLMQVFAGIMKQQEINGEFNEDEQRLFDCACGLTDKIVSNHFLMGMLYVGRQEETCSVYAQICEAYGCVKTSLINSGFIPPHPRIEQNLLQLAYIDVEQLEMPYLDVPRVETITYCVQPLLAVEILLNPCKETSYFVAELQMLQRLKGYSITRLYYEIIRAGFIALSDATDTSHDTIWGAFTFFKVPQVIKYLNNVNRTGYEPTPAPTDHIPEVVTALEMLLADSLLLDFMDTKCNCNIIEYLLNDWQKQQLVNEGHVKLFAGKRENVLQKRETPNQAPSLINYIIRAEMPLSGLLKTLSRDYNKCQEALLGVLCQLLVGNSFELILAVATVEGRLKTFVSRLIQCNENSKQVQGETGKPLIVRSTLFDVSMLMLTFIVQTYGSEVVLSDDGDSFFEKWMRECMMEQKKPKNPGDMIAACDENIVDELLLSFSKPEAQLKNSTLTWQDVCMNLPAVLHHVLIAWEKETLSSADVKGILDNIKRRLFSFSVCATSFLSAYMSTVGENELLKPLNMIQQFLTPPTTEEMATMENAKERMSLAFQIIRKLQHDVHPTGNTKSRNISQPIMTNAPLVEPFKETWKTVTEHGWLPMRAAQQIGALLEAGGHTWLIRHLVEEILRCEYPKDMTKMMDFVFAILHLDIERATEELLQDIVPQIVMDREGESVNEPQLLVLARLCVFCLVSSLERMQPVAVPQKKRSRSRDSDDGNGGAEPSTSHNAKVRKVVAEGGVAGGSAVVAGAGNDSSAAAVSAENSGVSGSVGSVNPETSPSNDFPITENSPHSISAAPPATPTAMETVPSAAEATPTEAAITTVAEAPVTESPADENSNSGSGVASTAVATSAATPSAPATPSTEIVVATTTTSPNDGGCPADESGGPIGSVGGSVGVNESVGEGDGDGGNNANGNGNGTTNSGDGNQPSSSPPNGSNNGSVPGAGPATVTTTTAAATPTSTATATSTTVTTGPGSVPGLGTGSNTSNDSPIGPIVAPTDPPLEISDPVMRDSLQASIQHIFKVFQQFVNTAELSPKVYFVYYFLSMLLQYGQDQVRPVIKLLPANLIANLLKVVAADDITIGFIARMYDMDVNAARQAAVADMCLWRNINLQKQFVQL